MKAYLALGSNIGDRQAHLAFARDQLEEKGVYILGASTIEDTEPIGGPSQPRYLNQVLEVETDQGPSALLDLCKAIERRGGRQPGGVRWGPRELDIDILLYEHISVNTPQLTIPHPQLANRDFLLRGLREVNPRLTDKISGITAQQLRRQLEPED